VLPGKRCYSDAAAAIVWIRAVYSRPDRAEGAESPRDLSARLACWHCFINFIKAWLVLVRWGGRPILPTIYATEDVNDRLPMRDMHLIAGFAGGLAACLRAT